MMNDVILSAAKNLPCDGQMLHFVQHDSPSNKLRQSTIYQRIMLTVYQNIAPHYSNFSGEMIERLTSDNGNTEKQTAL